MAKMLTLHPVSRWAGNQSASGGWPGVRAWGVRSGGWQAGEEWDGTVDVLAFISVLQLNGCCLPLH